MIQYEIEKKQKEDRALKECLKSIQSSLESIASSLSYFVEERKKEDVQEIHINTA